MRNRDVNPWTLTLDFSREKIDRQKVMWNIYAVMIKACFWVWDVACGPIAVGGCDNIGEFGVPLMECEPQEMRLNLSLS